MLSSFKKLLLRKTDSEEMQALVKGLSQESLAEYVVEALEKMAHYRGSASAPNASLADFTEKLKVQKDLMDGEEPGMVASIRDAMGHHASAYKKSLEQGKMADAASHARRFVQYGNLAYKVSRQAPDVLSFDAPSLQPWQKNDSRFLQKDGKWNCTGWKAHHDNGGDFSWLRTEPHASYAKETYRTPHKVEDGKEHYHDGHYPMEHAKINNRYITLHDDAEPGQAHPMDRHPIMDVFHAGDKQHNETHAAKYKEDLAKYEGSSHFKDINDRILERAMNPESGKEVGEPVHKPVIKQESNVDQKVNDKTEPEDTVKQADAQVSKPDIKSANADLEAQLAKLSPDEIEQMLARIRSK